MLQEIVQLCTCTLLYCIGKHLSQVWRITNFRTESDISFPRGTVFISVNRFNIGYL